VTYEAVQISSFFKFESRALVFITKNGAFEIRDSRDEDVIKTTALASTGMGRGI